VKLPKIIPLLVIVVPVLLSVPFAAEPLARDQGYFAYGGWRLLHGEFPYSDFWANTFPGVFGWYTLMNVFALGGYLGHPLWNGLVIGLTSYGIMRLRPDLAGFFGGLGYGILCTVLHRFWDIAQAEQLMNLFAVFALHVLWNRRQPFVSGLLFGLAVLTKPTAVLLAPLLLFRARPGIVRVLGGAGIAVCLFVVPYAVSGNGSELFGDLIAFNAIYGSSRWDLSLLRRSVVHFRDWLLPVLPLVGCAIPGWLRSTRREGVVYWWFVLALLGILVQAKLFSYHWISLLPPFALLCGFGVDRVVRGSTARRLLACGVTVTTVLIAFRPLVNTWYPAYHEAKLGIVHLCGGSSREEYVSAFGNKTSGSDFSAAAQRAVSTYIRQLSGQTLLVWGFEPGINYLCKYPCPTQYVVDFPLTFVPGSEMARRVRSAHRQQFLFEIRAHPPDVFVVAQDDQNPVEREDSFTQLRSFPQLRFFLESRYQPLEAFDTGYLVFLRKGP
jgi:hypothetical protein